jgi:hypothetical protein
MTKKPFVRIARGNEFFGRLRDLHVYINGEHVGVVKPGSKSDFPVSPGEVRIYVKMDWLKSAEARYSMDTDKNGFVPLDVELPKGGPSVKGVPLSILWAVIGDAREFFQLKPARSFESQL